MIARLALALTLCWSAHAQEITIDHIVGAVCQIESGTIWKGPGIVSGTYTRGSAGESGPWQAMAYTAHAIERDSGRNHASVQYAETTFRLWYAHLLHKHGSHAEALAAYHRGSAGRHRKEAKEYAQRALNLAERLASESN